LISQLQEWLERFAERLKERTKEVAAEVDRLGTQAGNVELHLQNSFNSLRALSATQFIENVRLRSDCMRHQLEMLN
jgi:hypothetical protein